MDEIIEKLNIIKDQIVSEKTDGKLRFFGLLARMDFAGKWDLLISADWVKKNNSEDDLIYVIKKIKAEFGANLDFLGKIILLNESVSFIQQLARAITSRNGGKTEEIFNLMTSADFSVDHLYVIAFNFNGIDLENIKASQEEAVAMKDVDDFK